MGLLGFFLLITVPAATVSAAPGIGSSGAPELLLKTLAALAGSSARDCGAVRLGGDRNAAITCARDAARSGSAYRLAIEMSGVDTYTWQGAARDDRGRMWVVFYDADSSAGPGARPGLGQLLCRDITFAPEKDEVIDCTPATGGQ